jgi:hypothetical protein
MGKMKELAIEQDTMRIWNAVSRTDIDHTKPVSFGARKFTAIDAHYQIMEATRIFGPIGEGWGYQNIYDTICLQDGKVLAWCDVTIWWSIPGTWEGIKAPSKRNRFGPIRGCAVLIGASADGKSKAPDTDAFKKSSTDALTKGLSHLGFNADVFLGMFDDNKYVAELKKDKEAALSVSSNEQVKQRTDFISKIQGAKDVAAIDVVMESFKDYVNKLPVGVAVELRAWVEKQKTQRG